MLPSESTTNAIHSSVPAGPSRSSSWLKITLRLPDDLDASGTQCLDGLVHVSDTEVDQRRWRGGVEEQADAVEIEEEQTWRIEAGRRAGPEQVGVELFGPGEVVSVLGHLDETHPVSFRSNPIEW